MLLFLTGFMGSGKTTLGKRLATLLHYGFVDLDELIEQQTGRSIPDLFLKGEHGFREIETMVLHSLADADNMVVSTGGGTACFNDNIAWMNSHGITIYIRMSAGSLFHRLSGSKQKRPLLAGKADVELMEYITDTLREREYFYTRSHYTVKGENLDAAALLAEIEKGESQLR